MVSLQLAVKERFFREIESGEKTEEYRLYKVFWRKRLTDLETGEPKNFDEIIITLGYPKAGDEAKTIIRPWRGFTIKPIIHPLFGSQPVKVFAIRVNL